MYDLNKLKNAIFFIIIIKLEQNIELQIQCFVYIYKLDD